MNTYELKYGCNPDQLPARILTEDGTALPITVLGGRPGYINFLDALNAWQLVRELKQATGLAAAASFKHVSPSGSALGLPLSGTLRRACFVDDIEGLNDSPVACAYARARGTDRLSSFGDWAALSETCDAVTARILKREVSDGIIAPGYTPEALEILRTKKKGSYNIVQIDPAYEPAEIERKQVFGVTFEQRRPAGVIDRDLLIRDRESGGIVTRAKELPETAVRDLLVSLITLRYTQSNSVCFAADGQAIGVGAGQQSRVHCTRLAASKADAWHLRQHAKVLDLPFKEGISRAVRDNVIDAYIHDYEEDPTAADVWERYFTERPAPLTREEKENYLAGIDGVSLGSDAFFPFSDNIARAAQSGVRYIAQPGGSVRDDEVIAACDERGIVMTMTGLRLFHH